MSIASILGLYPLNLAKPALNSHIGIPEQSWSKSFPTGKISSPSCYDGGCVRSLKTWNSEIIPFGRSKIISIDWLFASNILFEFAFRLHSVTLPKLCACTPASAFLPSSDWAGNRSFSLFFFWDRLSAFVKKPCSILSGRGLMSTLPYSYFRKISFHP